MRGDIRSLLDGQTPAERQKFADSIRDQEKNWSGYLESYGKSKLTKEEQNALARIKANFQEYTSHRNRALELAMANKDAEAIKILDGEARTSLNSLRKEVRGLIDLNAKNAEEFEKESEETTAAGLNQLIVFVVFGFLVAVASGIFIARTISKGIIKVIEGAGKIAVGDVNVAIDTDSKDELGMLAKSFRAMIDMIKERAGEADRISAGDLAVEVKPRSDKDALGKGFATVVATLRGLVSEAGMLSKAGVEGRLSKGNWRRARRRASTRVISRRSWPA
jgi:methyl-accepting chemotaxis protein